MKTTNKLTVLAVCLIAAAALVTTSCSGFGKDDFYGTWNSGNYTLDTGSHKGDTVNVTFYFSGTSENLLNGGSAMFYEEYTRYSGTDTSVDPVSHNFWWGNYKLSDNSGVTSGTLTLRYFYGYNLNQKDAKSVSDLVQIVEGDDPYTAFEKITPAATDFYDETLKTCSDVEKFTFALGDQDFFKGYQSLIATSVSQWSEFTGKETDTTLTDCNKGYTKDTPAEGTSWGKKDVARTFTLQDDNGSAVKVADSVATAAASTNVIGTTVDTTTVDPATLEK
jgi:hypothetical protein